MTDLRADLGEAVGTAFAEAGLSASYGRVTPSDRPDLADFQCNGALAAARAAKRNPREIASAVADSSVSLDGATWRERSNWMRREVSTVTKYHGFASAELR